MSDDQVARLKKQIDAMSYEEMLRNWRFAPVGSPFFTGDVGEYYAAAMKKKRDEVGHDEAVRVSKNLGW